MPRYHGAIWRPLARTITSRMTAHNRVNLHVAVSEAASLHGFFSGAGRPWSHFYVRKDGTVEQYVDTDFRSGADLDGNDATISIETQGGVTSPQGEPWTPEQVEALARLFAWAVQTHGIELRLAESSHLGERSRGLSWHRLGVDGDFPALPDLRAGRLQRGGGMRYSTARGKVCPGDAKILQAPGILARARELLDVEPVVNPVAPPPPAAPAPARPSPAPTSGGINVAALPVLKRGSKGVAVRRLQGLLLANGFSVGRAGIDGDFGPSTDAGFRAFQTRHPQTGTNGKPDGSCGPRSWATLLGL